MAKNKISISIPQEDTYIYDFLKSKSNISSYICSLVKKDLDSSSCSENDIEKQIKEILNEVLNQNGLLNRNQGETLDLVKLRKESVINTDDMTEEERDTIANIF